MTATHLFNVFEPSSARALQLQFARIGSHQPRGGRMKPSPVAGNPSGLKRKNVLNGA